MTLRTKNGAETRLASDITASTTTVIVEDGSVFPILGDGEWFPVVFESAESVEYARATARNGNALTVVRNAEGGGAAGFPAGSFASLRITDAVLDLFETKGTTVPLPSFAGSANALTVTLDGVVELVDGTTVDALTTFDNTGSAVTLTVNDFATTPVKLPGGEALVAGSIRADSPVRMVYNADDASFVLANPVPVPVNASTSVRGIIQIGTETALDSNGDNTKATTQRNVSRIVTEAIDAIPEVDVPSIILPQHVSYLGDARLGSVTVTSGNTSNRNTTDEHHFNALTVANGGTLFARQSGTLVLRGTGKFTLSGELIFPLNAMAYPYPVCGPAGSYANNGTAQDANHPPQVRIGFDLANTDQQHSGGQINFREVQSALAKGYPMDVFGGGAAATYSQQRKSINPGGVVIIFDEIELTSTAVVSNMAPTPVVPVTHGPGGGGLLLLIGRAVTVDGSAKFEAYDPSSAGTTDNHKTKSEMQALTAQGPAVPLAGNGQAFVVSLADGSVTEVF